MVLHEFKVSKWDRLGQCNAVFYKSKCTIYLVIVQAWRVGTTRPCSNDGCITPWNCSNVLENPGWTVANIMQRSLIVLLMRFQQVHSGLYDYKY